MDQTDIRLARDRADYDACVALQRQLFGLGDLEITSALHFMAATWAGALLHIAETDGRVVAFAFAFPGLRGGTPHLHSDLLAVAPEHQQRGLAFRLKWRQREDALLRGVRSITWTYDPLQARQGHLALRRLGATAEEFVPDFYGPTLPGLHHGLPSDRLAVRWDLESPRVLERLHSDELSATVPTPDAPRINEVKWQAGWPVSSDPDLALEHPTLLLEVPPDWDVLSRSGPRVAQDWQGKIRRALATYLARGYVAADFAPTEESGRRRPFYVLRQTS